MNHLTERQLTSVFQETLPAELEERILLHLAKCESCERRTKPAVERYRMLRRELAKELPPPPQRWRDILMEMDRADAILPLLAPSEAARKPRPVWTGLAAGAVLSGVLFLWPRPDANLRAETLLPQIEDSVSRAPAHTRQGLRVRTSTETFVRSALLGAADRADRHWRERFREANYDWDDPMSPRAFSEWRNRVKHKSDRVLVSPASSTAPKQFTIQTKTRENILEDASLTVDAASLLPVRARFVFSGENWIEISVVPDLSPEAEMAVLPGRTLPKSAEGGEPRGVLPPSETGYQASTELAVWLIADGLNDPKGEPIRMDIRGGSRISVTPYSLNRGQLQQLSANLQDLPGVDLHIPDSSQSAPEAPPERDPVVNLSELIFSRAHLLADLEEHFPEAAEMKLTLSARTELWQLRSRHASQLEREIQSLQALLQKPGPGPANDGMREVAAGSLMARLVNEAGRVNRSVTIISVDRTASSDVLSAWPTLATEITRLKELAHEYASSVAQGLEKLR